MFVKLSIYVRETSPKKLYTSKTKPLFHYQASTYSWSWNSSYTLHKSCEPMTIVPHYQGALPSSSNISSSLSAVGSRFSISASRLFILSSISKSFASRVCFSSSTWSHSSLASIHSIFLRKRLQTVIYWLFTSIGFQFLINKPTLWSFSVSAEWLSFT